MTPEDRKTKARECTERWRRENPEAYQAIRRRFREKHKARLRAEEHQYYLDNKEHLDQRARDRYYNDPDRHVKRLLGYARNRAKAKGLDFSLTKADIVIPELCPILGKPLEFGTDGPIGMSPSLDRVDSSKGYITGNVRVISHRANSLKSNSTIDEVRALLNYMEGLTP